MRLSTSAARSASAVLAVLVGVACSDAVSTAPVHVDAAAAKTTTASTASVLLRSTPLKSAIAVSAVITSAGGVVELPAAGLRLTFPAGAVTDSVAVQVRTASTSRIAYTLEPAGARFAQPVLVEQTLPSATAANGVSSGDVVATSTAAAYTDASGGTISPDAVFALVLDTSRKKASFYTWYFSGYQLASGRKGK